LEADVVQTAVAGAALGSGRAVGFELQDRQVDRAVAEDVPVVARSPGRPQLREAEDFHVELRGGVGILARDRQMPELRHSGTPCCSPWQRIIAVATRERKPQSARTAPGAPASLNAPLSA